MALRLKSQANKINSLCIKQLAWQSHALNILKYDYRYTI